MGKKKQIAPSDLVQIGTVDHQLMENTSITSIELLKHGKICGVITVTTLTGIDIGKMVENLVRMGLKKPIEWI